MKKIFIALLVAAMLVPTVGCGKKPQKTETAKATESATHLAEETQPVIEVETETAEPVEEDINTTIVPEVNTDELGTKVDAADADYKSIEVLPITDNSFFIGKNLRLAGYLKDHKLTNMYSSETSAIFNTDFLKMYYKDEETGEKELSNYVYSVSEPQTSPNGCQYVYVTFGDHELTNENNSFETDIFMLVKLADNVDMGDASADTYVMLIETNEQVNGIYEIFKVD